MNPLDRKESSNIPEQHEVTDSKNLIKELDSIIQDITSTKLQSHELSDSPLTNNRDSVSFSPALREKETDLIGKKVLIDPTIKTLSEAKEKLEKANSLFLDNDPNKKYEAKTLRGEVISSLKHLRDKPKSVSTFVEKLEKQVEHIPQTISVNRIPPPKTSGAYTLLESSEKDTLGQKLLTSSLKKDQKDISITSMAALGLKSDSIIKDVFITLCRTFGFGSKSYRALKKCMDCINRAHNLLKNDVTNISEKDLAFAEQDIYSALEHLDKIDDKTVSKDYLRQELNTMRDLFRDLAGLQTNDSPENRLELKTVASRLKKNAPIWSSIQRDTNHPLNAISKLRKTIIEKKSQEILPSLLQENTDSELLSSFANITEEKTLASICKKIISEKRITSVQMLFEQLDPSRKQNFLKAFAETMNPTEKDSLLEVMAFGKSTPIDTPLLQGLTDNKAAEALATLCLKEQDTNKLKALVETVLKNLKETYEKKEFLEAFAKQISTNQRNELLNNLNSTPFRQGFDRTLLGALLQQGRLLADENTSEKDFIDHLKLCQKMGITRETEDVSPLQYFPDDLATGKLLFQRGLCKLLFGGDAKEARSDLILAFQKENPPSEELRQALNENFIISALKQSSEKPLLEDFSLTGSAKSALQKLPNATLLYTESAASQTVASPKRRSDQDLEKNLSDLKAQIYNYQSKNLDEIKTLKNKLLAIKKEIKERDAETKTMRRRLDKIDAFIKETLQESPEKTSSIFTKKPNPLKLLEKKLHLLQVLSKEEQAALRTALFQQFGATFLDATPSKEPLPLVMQLSFDRSLQLRFSEESLAAFPPKLGDVLEKRETYSLDNQSKLTAENIEQTTLTPEKQTFLKEHFLEFKNTSGTKFVKERNTKMKDLETASNKKMLFSIVEDLSIEPISAANLLTLRLILNTINASTAASTLLPTFNPLFYQLFLAGAMPDAAFSTNMDKAYEHFIQLPVATFKDLQQLHIYLEKEGTYESSVLVLKGLLKKQPALLENIAKSDQQLAILANEGIREDGQPKANLFGLLVQTPPISTVLIEKGVYQPKDDIEKKLEEMEEVATSNLNNAKGFLEQLKEAQKEHPNIAPLITTYSTCVEALAIAQTKIKTFQETSPRDWHAFEGIVEEFAKVQNAFVQLKSYMEKSDSTEGGPLLAQLTKGDTQTFTLKQSNDPNNPNDLLAFLNLGLVLLQRLPLFLKDIEKKHPEVSGAKERLEELLTAINEGKRLEEPPSV